MVKITESDILEFIRKSSRGPYALRRLMAVWKVNSKDRLDFKKLLQNLIDSGRLILIKGGKYGLPRKMNLITGYVKAHPSGYGFVIPDNEDQEDLFIPPGSMREVLDGDRVIAREDTDRGKRVATIVRILERAHKIVIGRFKKSKHISFVIPNNPYLTQDIIIPKTKGLKPKKGQIVVVEILEYPTKYRNPTGKISEILGWPDDPTMDFQIVIKDNQLPNTFSSEALKELTNYQSITEKDLEGRLDLRELFTFTIDGEKAQDFDDAISLENASNNTFRVWIHIADVSHYVPEGSVLDQEAFSRGTSVYFPDLCIPMLPPELSNELCSLKPGKDRLTISIGIDLDREGKVLNFTISPSIINSNERITYHQVEDILSSKKILINHHTLQITLQTLINLTQTIRMVRMRNGSIDFDLPEPEIILDLQGDVQSITRAKRTIAHNLIEELMLKANTLVAEFFIKGAIPVIFRIHEPPEETDILNFFEFLHGLGWIKDNTTNQKLEHSDFQKIQEYFRGKPEEEVVNYLLLRSMKRARYSTKNIGHFGLAMKHYLHFTSPIRRYPDLIVQRSLKRVLQGERENIINDTTLPEKLTMIANHSSIRERIAEEAERKIVDMKRTRYMQERIGEEYRGIISSIMNFGFFVELEEIFVEGLVHIRNLGEDYYHFDERKHQLEGYRTKKIFHIGDRVLVRVIHVDFQKLHIDFNFISKLN